MQTRWIWAASAPFVLFGGMMAPACSSDTFSNGAADAAPDVASDGAGQEDAISVDAGTDRDPPAACDLTKPFLAPVPISELNTLDDEAHGQLTTDELTIYFYRKPKPDGAVDAGVGGADIYVASRQHRDEAFGAPSLVGVSSTFDDIDPAVTGDNLTLYFSSSRPGGNGGGYDLWVATRASVIGGFGIPAPVPVSALNTAGNDIQPALSPNGLRFYLSAEASGTYDLFSATRTTSTAFVLDPAGSFDALNSPVGANSPAISADDLTLYFTSKRTDGDAKGASDIWVSTRASTSAPFGNLRNVAELNTTASENPNYLSADGCRLYFSSNRGGDEDNYVATKPAL